MYIDIFFVHCVYITYDISTNGSHLIGATNKMINNSATPLVTKTVIRFSQRFEILEKKTEKYIEFYESYRATTDIFQKIRNPIKSQIGRQFA